MAEGRSIGIGGGGGTAGRHLVDGRNADDRMKEYEFLIDRLEPSRDGEYHGILIG